MKSKQSLESRLTSFLLESALKLADLISADVFVLVDSSGSELDLEKSDGIDKEFDPPLPHHHHHHHHHHRRSRGLRVWSSGASSLRSAFLRDGLRVREDDVEFASSSASTESSSSSTPPPPSSGFGRVVCGRGGGSNEAGICTSFRAEESSTESFASRRGPAEESFRNLTLPSGGGDFSVLRPSSPPSPSAIASSSSSRRKRRPPAKRKTHLKPKLSRLNIDDDYDGKDVVIGDRNDEDDGVVDDDDTLPLNLSFINKVPRGLIEDHRGRDAAGAHATSYSPRPTTNTASTSSSSAAAASSSCLPLLSAALPTPVSPNLPSSLSPLPPLETGSTSAATTTTTSRELFDFSPLKNHDGTDPMVPSPNRNGDVDRSDGNANTKNNTEALDDRQIADQAVGLMNLTPPERDHDSDENNDGNRDDYQNGSLDGSQVTASSVTNVTVASAMERAMAAAAAAAAAAHQSPVHAMYGLSAPFQVGSNEDYYANITHSLLSMLSQYSPTTSSARKSENTARSEDGRAAGEGTSNGGGVGKGGGGGVGGIGTGGGRSGRGRKKRESSPIAEGEIEALLSAKIRTGIESAPEENGTSGGNGTSDGGDSNGVLCLVTDDAVGGKPGRPRGKTSSENRRDHKASSSHTRRPFTCSLCKKTFTRKDTCREHLKRIHFREVLHCQVCNMAFNSRQTMWFHRKKTGHQYEIVPTNSLPDPEHAVDNQS